MSCDCNHFSLDNTPFLEMKETDWSYEGTLNTFFLSTNEYANNESDTYLDPYNCSIKPRPKEHETIAVVIEVT